MFFTQPGKISKNFNEGKRARYVPPARLYVFISVIFFFLLNYVADKQFENNLENQLFGEGAIVNVNADLPTTHIANKELLAVSVKRNANLGILIDEEVDKPKAMLSKALVDSLSNTLGKALKYGNIEANSSIVQFINAKLDNDLWSYLSDSIAIYPEGEKFRIRMVTPKQQLQNDSLTGVKWLNNDTFISSRARELTGNNKGFDYQLIKSLIKLNMGVKYETPTAFKSRLGNLSHKILKNLSLAMFLLMPITALILNLLYFRKTYYYEHFIYSIFHHAFAFIWFSLFILVGQLISSVILSFVLISIFFIYLLLSFKGNYGQPWFLTCLKFIVFILVYFMLFSFLSAGTILIGLL